MSRAPYLLLSLRYIIIRYISIFKYLKKGLFKIILLLYLYKISSLKLSYIFRIFGYKLNIDFKYLREILIRIIKLLKK
jgi:hypothetical protein